MAEKENVKKPTPQKEPPEVEPQKQKTFIPRLKWLITQVILTWQGIAWVILITILLFILSGNFDITSIRAGGFEMVLQKKANDLGISKSNAFEALKNLNEEELKIFLIMGGDDANYYRFANTRLSVSAANSIYLKLQSDSLIRISPLNKIPNRNDSTSIEPTEIGKKVHRALIQSIYSQLIK